MTILCTYDAIWQMKVTKFSTFQGPSIVSQRAREEFFFFLLYCRPMTVQLTVSDPLIIDIRTLVDSTSSSHP